MKVIKLNKNNQRVVLAEAVSVLKKGGAVVYPTDTSYGLGVNALNSKALQKMYRIKERGANQPVHVVVPSLSYAKKLVVWNNTAAKLAQAFLPGPLSLALPLKSKNANLKKISSNRYLGLRFPKNSFAHKMTALLKSPITATSANPSKKIGGFDPYSAENVVKQFERRNNKPDLIIDAGRLKKVKPSTFVLVKGDNVEILRRGPVSEKEIKQVLS